MSEKIPVKRPFRMRQGEPVRGRVPHIPPSGTLPYLSLSDQPDRVVCVLEKEHLRQSITIPTPAFLNLDNLHETIEEDWPQIIREQTSASNLLYHPIHVSARTSWNLESEEKRFLGLLDRAPVIFGRSRAIQAEELSESVVAIVHFGLTRTQELQFREEMSPPPDDPTPSSIVATRDRATRLVVEHPKVHKMTIRSEPYVIATGRGYACAIDVSLPRDQGPMKYLICSPKTLARELEKIRAENGGHLLGTKLKVSREGNEMTASYRVERL